MFTRIVLAVSLAMSAAPAYAGGSMSSEVRVMVVKPSRTMQRIDRQIRRERAAQSIIKVERRAQAQAQRDMERQAEQADRDYRKKVDQQRKDRTKKKK